MDINDTGKDEVLDKLLANISKAEDELMNCTDPKIRQEKKELIAKLSMVYAGMIHKKDARASLTRRKSLYQPGQMQPAEKMALLELIEKS